uniref:Tetraspanin n=1 Tax=Maylandia zebra TaxID=106582 RepID=A0A3P9D1A2_9CICH
MALGGGIKCVKYLMFIFNLFFWLAGTAVLAIGLWLRLDQKTKSLFEEPDSSYVFYTGVYILIAAGALIMVVGFLGCCGAIRESPCMLGTVWVWRFMCLCDIYYIIVSPFTAVLQVVNDITGFYTQTYNNYKSNGDEHLKETLRVIQAELNCCGPNGRLEETNTETCPKGELLEELITKSCPDAIEEVFNSKLHIIGGVGIAIGVIMVFGMIFSMLLCCAIRRSREVV